MSDKSPAPPSQVSSRRQFMQRSSAIVAGGAVVANLALARSAHAAGSDVIKIGLIGCGGRGSGAAAQAMNTEGATKLVAMGDTYGDRLQGALRGLISQHKDKVDVPKERQFVGLDCYKKVLAEDIDLVILATPPGFRPLHVEAAVKAKKHIFCEKPVATDAPGVRRVLAAAEEQKKQGKALAVGLQRRHEIAYREVIGKLQEGAIGDIVYTRVYWNGDGVWVRPRQKDQTELDYQLRNWYYFNWLCGDHIVEQHIHNLDVGNWLKNAYPVSAQGQGGRQVRTGKDFGEIYDHHAVEYTYADGTKMMSQCRHIENCWNAVSEFAHGSKGRCDISGGRIYDASDKLIFHSKGARNGHQVEHHHLFADLREGKIAAEGEYGAMSTMTAILGRLATYSGKLISMKDALASNLSLANVDEMSKFTDEAPLKPDAQGNYHIAVPGKEKVL